MTDIPNTTEPRVLAHHEEYEQMRSTWQASLTTAATAAADLREGVRKCPICGRRLTAQGTDGELLDDGQPHDTEQRPCQPALDAAVPVELALGPGFGTAHGLTRTDWTTGHTYYQLTGPRMAGTWTLSPAHAADTASIERLDIHYGQYRTPDRPSHLRTDNPVLNRIEISGSTTGLDISDISSIRGSRIVCTRAISGGDIPDRTREHMAAILRALVTHFAARPEVNRIHHAAAIHQARALREEATTRAAAAETRLAETITELTDQRDHYRAHARRYDRIAHTLTLPGPPEPTHTPPSSTRDL